MCANWISWQDIIKSIYIQFRQVMGKTKVGVCRSILLNCPVLFLLKKHSLKRLHALNAISLLSMISVSTHCYINSRQCQIYGNIRCYLYKKLNHETLFCNSLYGKSDGSLFFCPFPILGYLYQEKKPFFLSECLSLRSSLDLPVLGLLFSCNTTWHN